MSESLEAATIDFVNEVSHARCLHLSDKSQLTVSEFVDYLGINATLEPHLIWIAREMLCSPLPPNAEQVNSKSGIVYFHDIPNKLYTLEHPLTQRYLKVLERQRLDTIAIRMEPSIANLMMSQSDMLVQGDMRLLQIPCEDCGVFQSSMRCNQCLMSFCDGCYENLHAVSKGPRKDHTFYQTANGSLCSACATKKPQSYCMTCEDYFCFACYEEMHKRGFRTDHKAVLVTAADSDMIDSRIKCAECQDQVACVSCDYCKDKLCITCFWKLHLNGNRRYHTATKSSLNPLCNQCTNIRATVFCEQCQDLYCTECFTSFHSKGSRQVHLFIDASNLVLLLERMDTVFSNKMQLSRRHVIASLARIQAVFRGYIVRKYYKKQKHKLIDLQNRWRGKNTRSKMTAILDQFHWKKTQFDSYFKAQT